MQGAADPKQPYTYADFDYNGIYHVPVKADGSVYLAPIRLSDIFEVIGRGTDDEGTHYHIIRYGDNEHCIIPRGDVGTSEGWRYLRNVINVPSARRKLDLLTEYIQTEAMKPEVMAAEWRITDVAGWHDDAYILPNGDIIGDNERLYFSGKIGYNKRIGYKSGGSLCRAAAGPPKSRWRHSSHLWPIKQRQDNHSTYSAIGVGTWPRHR